MPSFANLGEAAKAALDRQKTDYLALPAPCKYEDIQREIMMALKPDLFEVSAWAYTRNRLDLIPIYRPAQAH